MGKFFRVVLGLLCIVCAVSLVLSVSKYGVNIKDKLNITFLNTVKVDAKDATNSIKDDKVAKSDEVKSIKIDFGAGNLAIANSENEYYQIEINSDLKYEYGLKGDQLYFENAAGTFDWDVSVNEVTIYIPKDAGLESVDIEIGAGKCVIDNLNVINKADLSVGAGELDISNLETANLDITVDAGACNAENIKAEELDAEIGMGSLEATGKILGDADIDCSMGEVVLNLEGKLEDYNYDIDCSMGEVEIGNIKCDGISDDRQIENDAAYNCYIDCSMGQVSINFK